MTDEQTRRHQESIGRASRYRETSYAIADPDTLILVTQTPEGLSTPQSKLHRIRRKEVGSGRSSRSDPTGTVTSSKEVRASSMPTPRKDIKEQGIRFSTPNDNT